MYITLDLSDEDDYKNEEKIPSNLPKPDFMPTRLVRIYDMAVVSGSHVNEGYCALSYSWNQSGKILPDQATGEYKRIDEGKHRIISYDNDMFPDMIIPYHKTRYIDKLLKIYAVMKNMGRNKYYFTKTIKYVKFEGIIQKICQILNIKYIWYDQMCINQDDKEEKHHEIRNMHLIYNNSYCTVALVPDYKRRNTYLGLTGEQYFKRLWTLEEAIKSERLLFVGENIFIWGDDIKAEQDTALLSKSSSELTVAQILHHAHERTSTKGHDRVFALIHLFPEFMEHINIDYDQPLEDLMIQFYGLLAKTDISILLFEINYFYNSTIQKYEFLPSWTGVNGKHITYDVTTSFRNYDVIGKTMHVTSKFVTNSQLIDNDALTIRKEDLPPPPGGINYFNKYDYALCISVQLPGTSDKRNFSLIYSYHNIVVKEECFDRISENLKQLSRFMETKKENLYWCHTGSEGYRKVIEIYLNCLTEDVDNLSAEYIILSEISFKSIYNHLYYPVVKKKQGKEYYTAIGCCYTKCRNDIFSDCNLPKQTFSIQ